MKTKLEQEIEVMKPTGEPKKYILEEWDSMCAKGHKDLQGNCPLIEDEVLVEMHKYVGALDNRIAELEQSMPKWISVKDELPNTYNSYDSYGTDLTVSDPVVTDKGVACYCSEHDAYTAPCWVLIDWDHSEAGRLLIGVDYWMPLPELRGQCK